MAISSKNTQHEAVAKICVALGIDPKRCYSLTLRIETDAIIRMEVGLLPSPDEIEKLAEVMSESDMRTMIGNSWGGPIDYSIDGKPPIWGSAPDHAKALERMYAKSEPIHMPLGIMGVKEMEHKSIPDLSKEMSNGD